jgi:hypothetical protein
MSFTTYFTLSQLQYLILALFGGVLLFILIALGYWSYRLSLTRHDPKRDDRVMDFPDGLQETNRPVPLFMILLICFVLMWGVAYVIAIVGGILHAQ